MNGGSQEFANRRSDDLWRKKMDEKVDANAASIAGVAQKHDQLAAAVGLNNTQTQRMFDIFLAVENGLRFFGKLYDGLVWAATKIAKLAKPLIYILALIAAAIAFFKTGKWEFPL